MSERKRVNLQLDRCTGCYACAVACIDQHYETEDYSSLQISTRQSLFKA